MRNRQKQREHKKKQLEERLDSRNGAGYFDYTAYKAVERLREGKRVAATKA